MSFSRGWFGSGGVGRGRVFAVVVRAGVLVAAVVTALLSVAGTASAVVDDQGRRVWKLRGAENIPGVTDAVVDKDGSIVVASSCIVEGRCLQQVVRLQPSGNFDVIAGNGRTVDPYALPPTDDGGLATEADLSGLIRRVAIAPSGEVMFLDGASPQAGHLTRIVSVHDGLLYTVLGYEYDQKTGVIGEKKIRVKDSNDTVTLHPEHIVVSGPDVLVSTSAQSSFAQSSFAVWRLTLENHEWVVEQVLGGGDGLLDGELRPALGINIPADGYHYAMFSTHDGFGLRYRHLAHDGGEGPILNNGRTVRATRDEEGFYTIRSVDQNHHVLLNSSFDDRCLEEADGSLIMLKNWSPTGDCWNALLRLSKDEQSVTELVPFKHADTGEFYYYDEDDEDCDWGGSHPRGELPSYYDASGTPLADAHVFASSNTKLLASFPGGGFIFADSGNLRLVGPGESDGRLHGLTQEVQEVINKSGDVSLSREERKGAVAFIAGVRKYLSKMAGKGSDRYLQFLKIHVGNLVKPQSDEVNLESKSGSELGSEDRSQDPEVDSGSKSEPELGSEDQLSYFSVLPAYVLGEILSFVKSNSNGKHQPVLRYLAASALDLIEAGKQSGPAG